MQVLHRSQTVTRRYQWLVRRFLAVADAADIRIVARLRARRRERALARRVRWNERCFDDGFRWRVVVVVVERRWNRLRRTRRSVERAQRRQRPAAYWFIVVSVGGSHHCSLPNSSQNDCLVGYHASETPFPSALVTGCCSKARFTSDWILRRHYPQQTLLTETKDPLDTHRHLLDGVERVTQLLLDLVHQNAKNDAQSFVR